jgi:hypothetical protein
MRPARLYRYRNAREADWDVRRWPNFRPNEIACKCNGRFCGSTGEVVFTAAFLDAVQQVRNALGEPLYSSSWHRCALHNQHVGGAPQSMHKTIAADLYPPPGSPGKNRLYKAVLESPFASGGVGYYSGWLHVDLGPRRRWRSSAGVEALWI